MAFERGDTASARNRFEEVVDTCPYDYYAIRARMHLNLGGDAVKSACTDPKTLEQLKYAYKADRPGTSLPGDSPYHYRLGRALQSGLYSRALAASEQLREIFPSRLPNEISIDELDRAGVLTPLALLLSLRQDAVAAATWSPDAANRLSVASAVGRAGGDWPFAMLLVFGLDRSLSTQSGMQHDPLYLPVAYAPVYRDLIYEAAEANDVPPDLLYSIMRRESLFHPTAISKRGALGLFQFMPSAFAVLDKRWDLLDRSGMPSMEAFLFDPHLTIDLGARWFGEELLKRNDGNILLAVMEHNAGYPAVKAWLESWESAGRSDDIEYMIETARFVETRIFTRSVLTDIALADAMRLFK
jgi:soluble lytic murein transglycosylase